MYYIVHILIAHMWWWTAVGHVFVVLHYICTTVHIVCTVFPDIVSAETILFLIWKLQKIQIAVANFIFLPNKLNFYWGNYSRVETVWGNTVYEWQAKQVLIQAIAKSSARSPNNTSVVDSIKAICVQTKCKQVHSAQFAIGC